MARTSGRSEQEIEHLLNGFKPSGLTRRQYCEQQGIAVTTFDYYRLRRQRTTKKEHPHSTPLVKVELTKPAQASAPVAQQQPVVSPWCWPTAGASKVAGSTPSKNWPG